MRHSLTRSVSMIAVSALLVTPGCAVGPDFLSPKAPDNAGYTQGDSLPEKTAATDMPGGEAQAFVSDKDIPADWWTLFQSDALNALMAQALKANPDLAAAKAALKQAQENTYALQGEQLPAVDLNGDASRQKTSGARFGSSSFSGSTFTLYNASVDVSYGLDIFGQLRRAIEARKAQEDFARFELEGAYLTLTANVVTAAVKEASLRQQVAATQAVVDSQTQQVGILTKQLQLGAVPKTGLLAAQTQLAQTQATIAPLQKQLAQVHNQLAALTGQFPNAPLDDAFELSTLHLPEDVPISLPSKLVEQRPDIKAAESLMHAASAEIGVATANMLPQISLNASYGTEAASLGKMFSPSAEVWSLGAGLLQPIFHGGELLHEKRGAVAAYEQAQAQYQSTVLHAFENVADSLRALQFDADTLGAQTVAAKSASDSRDLAQVQFKAGSISYLVMLDSERDYQQAQLGLVQAQANRFADTAALYQALGGGWWNRSDTPPAPPANDTLPDALKSETPAPATTDATTTTPQPVPDAGETKPQDTPAPDTTDTKPQEAPADTSQPVPDASGGPRS